MVIVVFRFIKKVILSALVLYTYNLLAVNVGLMIPFNLITLSVITFLGVPGFFMLVLFKVFML